MAFFKGKADPNGQTVKLTLLSAIKGRNNAESKRSGLNGGAQKVLPYFPFKITAWGREWIPSSGPLLVVANHPGAYDSLALISCIPRADLNIMVSDIPFSRALENAKKHFIYVDFTSSGGMQALLSSIQNLREERAVLVFAHGEVEPDPEFMGGASETIDDWSSSIEIMLRKAPQTQVVLAITSGVFIPGFIHHPLTWLRTNPAARQKLAEFLQLMHQLKGNSSQKADVHISFNEFQFSRSSNAKDGIQALIKQAKELLSTHQQAIMFLKQD